MKDDYLKAQTLIEKFHHHVDFNPYKIAQVAIALNGQRSSISYRILAEQAQNVAHFLTDSGFTKQRVLILLPNTFQFTIAYLACHYAHCSVVPLPYPDDQNWQNLTPIVHHIAQDCDATVMITDTNFQKSNVGQITGRKWRFSQVIFQIEELSEQGFQERPSHYPELHSLAHILYTSGTTSSPKGVLLNHSAVFHNLVYTSERWNFNKDSLLLTFGPAYHSAGLMVGFLMPLLSGGTSFIFEPSTFQKNLNKILIEISHSQITHFACGNSAIEHILHSRQNSSFPDLNFKSLKSIVIGGEPLEGSILDRFILFASKQGLKEENIQTAYGMTEAAGLISTTEHAQKVSEIFIDIRDMSLNKVTPVNKNHNASRRLISCGTPSHEVKIKVVDRLNRLELQEGEIGEISFCSPSLFSGYLKENRPPQHFLTEDYGFLHKGELYLIGRCKEAIHYKGLLIHPVDLERLISSEIFLRNNGATIAVSENKIDETGILVMQEVSIETTRETLKNYAAQINTTINRIFSLIPIRIVFVPMKYLPKVITSVKKPRQRAQKAYHEGKLKTLEEFFYVNDKHDMEGK